ncbi:DUF2786 domain-containing protein [Nocardioides ferulae]|uniref:DUF2786 domain-containing protein n=1 Tax=Nocardioides ferulae TaxID=2340821 RepID=UPI000EB41189|nr:DUF2786 domain-containing protein [Nocardioides ferulae]
MTPTDPILAKVRKLLALAEDPAATSHEAETYTAKAAQLIADYGIDRALLAQADPGSDPVGDLVVSLDAPYAVDKAELLSTVAARLRCVAVQRTSRGAGGKELSMHLFGHASDLERAELLFTSLLLQSAQGLARTPVPAWEHKAAFRRSWLAGFRGAVGARLLAAEQRAADRADARFAEGGTTTAVVLADRTAQVEAAMHDTYPDLRTARPRVLSGSGGAAGWAAGHRADLGDGPARVGGGRTALGG